MLTLLVANTRAWLVVGGIFFAILLVIFLIDRFFSWIAENGPRMMRNDKSHGLMANVLGGFEDLIRPEKPLIREEREQRKAESGQTNPSDR